MPSMQRSACAAPQFPSEYRSISMRSVSANREKRTLGKRHRPHASQPPGLSHTIKDAFLGYAAGIAFVDGLDQDLHFSFIIPLFALKKGQGSFDN